MNIFLDPRLQRVNDTVRGGLIGYGFARGGTFLHMVLFFIVLDVAATLWSIRRLEKFKAQLQAEVDEDERRYQKLKRAVDEHCERGPLQ